MRPEPSVKRAVAFFDGQNLYYAAREAFGHRYPNFDPGALGRAICLAQGWVLAQTRFYTGVPDPRHDSNRHAFWSAKLAQMGREGVYAFSRTLRYRNRTVRLPDGTERSILVGQEKGIDIRIALDIVHLAHTNAYDIALVFSQDQDLSEVADEVRRISVEQGRWIKIASAFPTSPTSRNRRGINKTDWITIDRATYDACLDSRDYRPKPAAP